MKKQEVSSLKEDPVLASVADSGVETVAVEGFVRSNTEDTIMLSTSQTARTSVEYRHSDIVAAFSSEDTTRVQLHLKSGAVAKVVGYGCVGGCGAGQSGGRTAYLINRASISSILAELDMLGMNPFPTPPEVRCQVECDHRYHKDLSRGMDPDDARLTRVLCRMLCNEPFRL